MLCNNNKNHNRYNRSGYKNHNVVSAGDCNSVLDPKLDCYNDKHISNPKAEEAVEKMILELELTDIRREHNPQ